MKVGDKTYWAAEVLAGAYHGKALEARALLVHTVLVDERERIVKALCGYRKLDNLITDSLDENTEPTCATCAKRLEALRTKAFREWAHDGAVALTKGLSK